MLVYQRVRHVPPRVLNISNLVPILKTPQDRTRLALRCPTLVRVGHTYHTRMSTTTRFSRESKKTSRMAAAMAAEMGKVIGITGAMHIFRLMCDIDRRRWQL